jgi:cellulose synthase (UDP-forming)
MSKSQRVAYRLLMLVGVTTLVMFYVWWLQPEHVPANFTGWQHVFDWGIFLILTGVVSHRAFMDVYSWVVIRTIKPRRPSPNPRPGMKVAFITTFVPGTEGLDLLERTLPAMLSTRYPHDTWLLDEGADPAAKALCEKLGVHYFTRHGTREYNLVAGPFTAKTKGGNHNAWYQEHGFGYDIVAQIDTDFLPRADFLTQTLGYFADPKIAWVGTPQIYGNTDSFVALGAAQQQYMFYGPVLRGLGGRQMANLIGANHIVRVEALREIRFYAGHLTEDLLTGMRLHAKGWRSTYVAEPLAIGEGPTTWQAYFNQQMRWAYGCIDILRWHTRALTKTMPRNQAALYIALQQGYFSGIAGAVGILLLCGYFFGGLEISRVPLIGLVLWGGPFLLARELIGFWMQRFTVRPRLESGPYIAGRVLCLAVWPVYLLAFFGVLRQKPLSFKVTPKGKGTQTAVVPLALFRPHIVLALINLGCVIAGLIEPDRSVVLLFWAVLNTITLGSFAVMAVVVTLRARLRERAQARRLRVRVSATASVSAAARGAAAPVGATGSVVYADVVDRV